MAIAIVVRLPLPYVVFLLLLLAREKTATAQTAQTSPTPERQEDSSDRKDRACTVDVDCCPTAPSGCALLCDCPPPSEKLSSATHRRPAQLLATTLTCGSALLYSHENVLLQAVCTMTFGQAVFASSRGRFCIDKSGVCKVAFSNLPPQPPKRNYSIVLPANSNMTSATSTSSITKSTEITPPSVPSPVVNTPSPVAEALPCPTGALATCIASLDVTAATYGASVAECVELCN